MLQYEVLKHELNEKQAALDELKDALGLERLREEVEMLENKAAEPGFYDNMESAQKILQKTAALKQKDETYLNLVSRCEDTLTLIEMGNEEEDLSLLPEAQDWAEMLFRMYNRWGERHGFKVSTLDYLEGDEAGLKSASILVEGENAYGFLKSEAGVHRLVRVSPFDSAGRRHTSFSSLEVMPEIDEDLSVEINPDDIKMEVYRASGAGGQKVNKTSSAVRLIHIPTGIVVSCQVERSQYQNRDVAMKMLISKLVEIKEREHLEKISDIKGEQKEITWGSQIRSYVFMPYTLVKDHRTGCEKGNISAVMDGDLDDFITAYLKALSQGTLGENIE